MKAKRYLSILLLCAIAAVGCQTRIPIPGLGGKAPDEERIAKVLDDVQRAVETGKVDRAMSHISGSYQDAEGRNFDTLREYLFAIRQSYRNVRITRSAPRIIVDGDRARALEAFGTLADSENPAAAPPVNLQGQVIVYFAREEGDWKIIEWGLLQ